MKKHHKRIHHMGAHHKSHAHHKHPHRDPGHVAAHGHFHEGSPYHHKVAGKRGAGLPGLGTGY